jgi:hypothetical protein
MTSGGVAPLSVPVRTGSRDLSGDAPAKIQTKNIRIDNSKRWQHNHWMSIVSAYSAAPYFEHYADRLAPVYGRRWSRLVDLDLELLNIVTGALKLPTGAVRISETWVAPQPGDIDLRGKKSLRRGATGGATGSLSGSPTGEYTQVFHDRTPFVAGLSILDLLFCEGPSTPDFLK